LTLTRETISCMILTEDVCLASLAQLTSLAIDILGPRPSFTSLHVPFPLIPPTPNPEPALGGLVTVSELGVNALLPSEIGGEGGVECRTGDPRTAPSSSAAIIAGGGCRSFRTVYSSFKSRNSSFRRWFSMRRVSMAASSVLRRTISSVALSYFNCTSSSEDLTTLRYQLYSGGPGWGRIGGVGLFWRYRSLRSMSSLDISTSRNRC